MGGHWINQPSFYASRISRKYIEEHIASVVASHKCTPSKTAVVVRERVVTIAEVKSISY
jgi:hypothetical protein